MGNFKTKLLTVNLKKTYEYKHTVKGTKIGWDKKVQKDKYIIHEGHAHKL